MRRSLRFLCVGLVLCAGAARAGVDRTFLTDLLSMSTPTADIEANNRAVDFVRTYLEARNVLCSVVTSSKGRKSLYASCVPGKEQDVLFVSHLDVVPAMRPDQYVPRTEGDWLVARGACDTKGNVAVICQALVALAGKASVAAFLATDEEGGPPEGGDATPVLAIKAGYLPRRFILVGDSAGEEPDQLFHAEKGHAKIRVTAHGKGGHSSRPWALDNPVPKLVAGWSKAMAAMPPPPTAEDKWRDCLSPTMLKAGSTANQISDTAEMTCSLRYTEPGGHEKWLSFLRETTGLDVTLLPKWREPVVTDPQDPNVQALLLSLQKRRPSLRLGRMSAATDASYYAPLKIPTVIFAADGRGPHGADERVSLSSLDCYADALVEFLQDGTNRRLR